MENERRTQDNKRRCSAMNTNSTKSFDKKQGLNILIRKNCISFETPNGEIYFKNWINMKKAIFKGQSVFFAPISTKNKVP